MKNRNPIAVALLPIVTFGIYSLYWDVQTKREMNNLGADIPTAWLIIVPFVNIWWLWKYSQGVEKVTEGQITAILSFILLWLVGSIGAAILQDTFNKVISPIAVATPAIPMPPADTPPTPTITSPPTSPV